MDGVKGLTKDRPLRLDQFHSLDHSTRKNGRTVKLLYFTRIYLINSTGMNDVNFTGRKWYNSGKSKLRLPAISKITGYSGTFPILLYFVNDFENNKDWFFCIILLKIEQDSSLRTIPKSNTIYSRFAPLLS